MQQYDPTFLKELDKVKVRTQYAKIVLLTFDEKPIKEIQGTISAGTVTVNGTAAVRRTLSLTMIANPEVSNIENIENLISINKKIKVFIGYDNYLVKYKEQYGDIIWFPLGTYVISNATLSSSATAFNISISGKDKMVMLDGTVGGILPASTSFHEIYVSDDNGIYTAVEYPTIFQIIQEAVHHIGGEPLHKIIIEDIDEQSKLLIKYNGDTPIHFKDDYSSFKISKSNQTNYPNTYVKGEDIGYELTDTTFPGELVLNAGQSVASMLDKIAKTFGNFEFFYDLDGNFRFREKRNYLNNSYTPITELNGESYVRAFSESPYSYTFNNEEGQITLNANPKYDNIKNDFVVWGQRETSSGTKIDFRYHLVIDEKPQLNLVNYYIYENIPYPFTLECEYNPSTGEMKNIENPPKEEHYYVTKDNIAYLYIKEEKRYQRVTSFYSDNFEKTLRYETTYLNGNSKSFVEINGIYYRLISAIVTNPDWREELYLQAVQRQILGDTSLIYDEELLANWRLIYDPIRWGGFSPDVANNPQNLSYWLDFIDTGSALGAYSVNMIGRRSKVVNDTNIKIMYTPEIPDIIFIQNDIKDEELQEIIKELNKEGQRYCLYKPSQADLFVASSTGTSAFDKIRELLYQHLTYNTQVTLTCQPKYYLEPNTLIYLKDINTNTNGAYTITQFTLPLTYNGTMSITCAEALTRI